MVVVYLGETIPFPSTTTYGVKGNVFFAGEREIIISNFNVTSPPGGYIYLGYGGSAGDYVDKGYKISKRLANLNNVTLTLPIRQDLKDLPYTHIAVICVPARFVINPGFKYK